MGQSKEGRYVSCTNCGCRLEMNGVCKICAHEDVPPLPYMVPDLIDILEATALTLLTGPECQLTAGTRTEDNHVSIPAGNIISTDPVKDTQLTKDAPVDYVVSLGPV